MSAIVIHPANERTRLVSGPSHSVQSSISRYVNGDDTPGTRGSTSTWATPREGSPILGPSEPAPSGSKVLDRSAPLRDSISRSRFVLICVGIWSSNFVFAFQSTAIPTLAPLISSEFNHSELASYLGSIFSLTSAAVIPVYGVFMDTLGRTFAMDTACFFYGLGTVMCALSPNMYVLIAARAFAGLGGGGLLTVSSVIVTDLVPLRDRGLYQGLMMTVFGSGSMIGGPVSGWLADKYGWHLSFWLQVPITVFCATIVTMVLPAQPIPPTHTSLLSGLASLDWIGTILLIGSVSTLLLGFSFHTSYLEPWSAPVVWGNLLASVVALVIFGWVETRVKSPLVPMRILRSKHRLAIMSSGLFLSIGNQAFMFQVPVYFTVVVKSSTAYAGLMLSLCGGAGLALGSMIAGQHIRRGGAYKRLGVYSLIPSVFCSWIAANWNPAWPWWGYYLTFFPASLGYSMFLCCQLIALITAVDSKNMPKATALLYTVRTLGVALGISIGGSIQIGAFASQMKKQFGDYPGRDEIISSILHSKAAIARLPPTLQNLALKAYASSISIVWISTGCIMILTVLSACFVQEKDVTGNSVKGSDSQAVNRDENA
ncbi:multidrug resistance protein fnx1 [Kockovaella imperatae]|uniref:Multidrug resistance protein fnx1 n=1 Tax=Kockovaella imperatae TaxID=4999 RepID=A0A1Y1U7A1_9TREE|nr:multidrug resistance protein fnx1 [Kockovaella imperatae]ORX33406.1 multidrug resistance protein fnx1 [Kockovaella imperatae]